MTATLATRRVNHGRGHSYLLDGQPVISVTKALREGYPKPALVGAAAKECGNYVLNHWDDLQGMQPAQRLDAVKKSYTDAWYGSAIQGIAVHQLAQQLAHGEEVDAGLLVGHVDSYLKFVNDWKPVELLVEASVFSREFHYAGTLDLVADLADGKRWLLDFKTSKSEPWPEAALQLAAYRYADFYLKDGDQTEHPMPRVERTGIIWVRADGYDLIPVNANAAAFEAFGVVQQVAAFRDTPRENWIQPSLQPPEEAAA